jgi:hypothetical protein
MIHKVVIPLVCALLAVTVHAQDASSPLVIVTPARGDSHVQSPALGWIGSGLVEAWFNGSIANDIKDFQRSAGRTDWDDLAMSDFSCIGVPAGKPCRDVFKFDGNEDAVIAKVRGTGATHVVVVSMFQQFNGVRYRARATLREIELGDKQSKVQRTLTAFYASDVPESVSREAKGNSDRLREYWTSGPNPMLDQEGRTSLRQLRDMLDTLYTADHNNGSAPDGWQGSKPIRELEAAGRAHCHGLPCFETKVFAEHDSYIWLATGRRGGDYGWTLICLDQNAALHNANWVIQSMPVLTKN